MKNTEKPLLANEDWIAVIIGCIIIAAVLVGFKPSLPAAGWSSMPELTGKVLSAENLLKFLIIFLILQSGNALAALLSGKSIQNITSSFPVIFGLTFAAQIAAGNSEVKSLGLEAVIFSLAFGLLIGNLFQLPGWLKEGLSAELFTKIGLVILGSSIVFKDILQSGTLGLLQALAVVISVWYFAYWLCRRIGIDDELTMLIASAVSICGVSAAIATAGAIKGDSKKLSYVISLVLIVAVPMMVLLPYAATQLGLSETVTGAWLGGTIDTTGAVVASGSLVGETALKISTIIKFSQNVLLGIAAFFISIYWTYSKKKTGVEKPSLRIIWERFPKFVVGFLLVSVCFSFFLAPELVSSGKDSLKGIQNWWFGIAFTCIGLETRFVDLIRLDNGKPAYAFLAAQLFNIIVCLGVACLLFG